MATQPQIQPRRAPILVPRSPAQHRAQPVPPVVRGGRIRPLYLATPPKLTARVALDHGSHATRGRTRSDVPGAPEPAGGSDACSRSGGRFAGRSSELADAHTKAVVAPRLRPAATSPLPGMELDSAGGTAALPPKQQRRRRRPRLEGRLQLVQRGQAAGQGTPTRPSLFGVLREARFTGLSSFLSVLQDNPSRPPKGAAPPSVGPMRAA
jgi:hypothetical protein